MLNPVADALRPWIVVDRRQSRQCDADLLDSLGGLVLGLVNIQAEVPRFGHGLRSWNDAGQSASSTCAAGTAVRQFSGSSVRV